MEALEIGATTKDPDLLTEYVRQKLARQIVQLYKDEKGKIYCFTVEPAIEKLIVKNTNSDQGSYLAIEPKIAQHLVQESMATLLEKK